MSVGLLLITHNRIGAELLEAATMVLGLCPLSAETISCPPDCDPEATLRHAKTRVDAVDRGDGVLVLTDLYGSSPGNVATGLCETGRVMVVAGVNLPMLVRVLNYASMELEELAHKAVSGARAGIILTTGRDDCALPAPAPVPQDAP